MKTNEQINLPYRLNRIVEEFRLCEGQEKLELLLQYAQLFPELHSGMQGMEWDGNLVHECSTPVIVHSEVNGQGRMTFHFDVPFDSPTVRGYAAILADGLNGAAPEEILAVPGDFHLSLGLENLLTHQRMRGFGAILAHMKRLALRELEKDLDKVNE